MSGDDQLSLLFAAEQAERRSPAAAAKGLEQLETALRANAPALAVAHGPLKLGASVAAKSLLGPVLVGFGLTSAALGAHAVLQPAPAPRASQLAPTPSTSPRTAATANVTTTASPSVVADAEAPPAIVPSPKPGASEKERPSTFAAELRLIKAAKNELDAGRAHLASIWLAEHARLYPHGVFAKEREALRSRLPAEPAPQKAPTTDLTK